MRGDPIAGEGNGVVEQDQAINLDQVAVRYHGREDRATARRTTVHQ